MSLSLLVRIVQNRLREAHYRDISTPFDVAGVEFNFTAAMRGDQGRALDLILIFDTTSGEFGDADANRIRQRVEALSRALDVTRSRYVVTAILVGAPLAGSTELLAETCRVLRVENVEASPDGELLDIDARMQLEDQIRVLLPLQIPELVSDTSAQFAEPMEQLVQQLPNVDKGLLDDVIAASEHGEQAVTDAVGLVIDKPFQHEEEADPS